MIPWRALLAIGVYCGIGSVIILAGTVFVTYVAAPIIGPYLQPESDIMYVTSISIYLTPIFGATVLAAYMAHKWPYGWWR